MLARMPRESLLKAQSRKKKKKQQQQQHNGSLSFIKKRGQREASHLTYLLLFSLKHSIICEVVEKCTSETKDSHEKKKKKVLFFFFFLFADNGRHLHINNKSKKLLFTYNDRTFVFQ